MFIVRGSLRALAVLSAALIVVMSATPARAQTQPPAPLGVELATLLFQSVDFKGMVVKEMAGFDNISGMEARPEWKAMLAEAATEEIEHDEPAIMRIFGRAFERHFTPGELRAGISLFRGPAGRELSEVVKAGAEGRTAAPFSRTAQKELERAAGNPDTLTFFQKLGKIDKLMAGEEIENDLVGELVPGMMLRFGAKAQAAEAARGRP